MSVTATDYPTESYTWLSDPCECSDPECPRSARHVFVWPLRPMTVNVAVRSHHRVVSAFTAEWREAFRLMAQGCVPLAWCTIVVEHLTATRRKVDVGAGALATKAAIDGIVDGGVLVDDGPDYVRRVTFNAPVYAGYDALIVTLDGPVA